MYRSLLIIGLLCLVICLASAAEVLTSEPPKMTGDQFKTIRHIGMLQAACIFWRTQQIFTKAARGFVREVLDQTPVLPEDPALLNRMRDLVMEPRFGGHLSCKKSSDQRVECTLFTHHPRPLPLRFLQPRSPILRHPRRLTRHHLPSAGLR